MKHDLILVALKPEQIEKAKSMNGSRKQITHAVICGPHGQLFGTQKQCIKYYSAWKDIFPSLFRKSMETSEHEIFDFKGTFNLVNKLIELDDKKRGET